MVKLSTALPKIKKIQDSFKLVLGINNFAWRIKKAPIQQLVFKLFCHIPWKHGFCYSSDSEKSRNLDFICLCNHNFPWFWIQCQVLQEKYKKAGILFWSCFSHHYQKRYNSQWIEWLLYFQQNYEGTFGWWKTSLHFNCWQELRLGFHKLLNDEHKQLI